MLVMPRTARCSRTVHQAMMRAAMCGWIVLVVQLASLPTFLSAASPQSDSSSITAAIDQHFEQYWQRCELQPAGRAEDHEFARRAYLDVVGRIPTAGELRWMLAADADGQRPQLVDQLLDSPEYVENFKNVWRHLLIPEADSDQQVRYVSLELEAWLRKQLSDDKPYDVWVRELLTVPLSARGQGAYMFYSGRAEPLPTAFYAAKDVKPENLASSTARIFLGLRVDCAQCHDHPFAHWKRREFWAYAAFYQGLERSRNNPFEALADLFRDGSTGPLTISIPETQDEVEASFLNNSPPSLSGRRPREVVAEWITSSENPYFARAAVNRLWAHLFGSGLLDPVDSLDSADFTEHAVLLDELAHQFVSSGFDVKGMLRGMLLSRPYQLSSRVTDSRQREVRHFARKAPKKMTAEQIYSSLQQARGGAYEDAFVNGFAGFDFGGDRYQFLQLFDDTVERPVERSTAVLEALARMNGPLTAAATDDAEAPLVRAVAELPGLTVEQRIEILFLSTLSRAPTDKERANLLARFDAVAAPQDQRLLYSDLLWALINCSQFVLN